MTIQYRHRGPIVKSSPHSSMTEVYSGRTCLGWIINCGREGFEAFSSDEKSCGLYASRREAADAISILESAS
jgi:hypothetical protein